MSAYDSPLSYPDMSLFCSRNLITDCFRMETDKETAMDASIKPLIKFALLALVLAVIASCMSAPTL